MNANNLAVYLEDITDSEESPYRQAATMLRQQFDQIADLQTTIKFLEEECKALRIQVNKAIEVDAK
jgi:hypothetical protein